jgi:hypothetical protein
MTSVFPFKPGDMIKYVYPREQDIIGEQLDAATRDDREEWLLRNRFVGNDIKVRELYRNRKNRSIIGFVVSVANCGPLGDGENLRNTFIWEMQVLIDENEYHAYLTPEEATECFDVVASG